MHDEPVLDREGARQLHVAIRARVTTLKGDGLAMSLTNTVLDRHRPTPIDTDHQGGAQFCASRCGETAVTDPIGYPCPTVVDLACAVGVSPVMFLPKRRSRS